MSDRHDTAAGPHRFSSYNRTSGDDQRKALVFVVPLGSISRALICAIEMEFPWLAVIAMADPETLAEEFSGEARLIVLAHQFFRKDREVVADIARRHQRAGLAILAESGDPVACSDLPQGLQLRGVLPMDVNLEIWLSILRIMLHGGSYVAPNFLLPKVFSGSAMSRDDGPVGGQRLTASADAEDTFVPNRPAQELGRAPPATEETPGQSHPTGEQGEGRSPLDSLSLRESEVLHLVSRGCQNKIIAAELDLAENTVKIHVHNIIRKLAVSNRTQAAALYLEEAGADRSRASDVAARPGWPS